MAHLKANLVGYVECRRQFLPMLIELAERVDRLAGVDPPTQGYGLVEAFTAVMNGGTGQDIQTALTILHGWSFESQ